MPVSYTHLIKFPCGDGDGLTCGGDGDALPVQGQVSMGEHGAPAPAGDVYKRQTLESMAWCLAHLDGEICAVMDARRNRCV